MADGVLFTTIAVQPQPVLLDYSSDDVPADPGEFAGLLSDGLPARLMTPGDVYEHSAWMAVTETAALNTSVDWFMHTCSIDSAHLMSSSIVTVDPMHVPMSLDDHPFFLDTGVTTHLSPEHADFLDLQPIQAIQPRSISGIGGSSIGAVGKGRIRLDVGSGLHGYGVMPAWLLMSLRLRILRLWDWTLRLNYSILDTLT
jgi:hypothetical protein